jgi:branched-chain amino acid transport system substrate-binding protein
MGSRFLTPLVVCALAFGAAACGGDDEEPATDTGSGGAAATESAAPVKFTFIADTTGPGALYGKGVVEGAQFNVDRINKAGGAAGHQLEMEVVDSASEQGQATAAMTKAARGDNAAVLYGVLSQNALAMAPIAQREKMPLIISYSSVDEVTKPGDYIFRTSTSEGKFYDGMVEYLNKNKGMKTMDVWFASDNATAVGNAEKTMPALAEKYGVKIVDSVSVKSTDTDFSSSAAQIAEKNPDGVAVLILGNAVNTAITALRRGGYDGALFGSSALGAGALTAAGESGKDTYYPASILTSPDVPWASGKTFLEEYEAATGKEPTAFNAAGSDQVQFLADAIAKAPDGEVDSEALHTALNEVAKTGFSGATGDPVKFDDQRIAVSPGLLVLWDGKKETFAPDQDTPLLDEYAGQ